MTNRTFHCRNTTLSDTFESNFPTTETGTIEWTRQMTEATATEVESTWSFPNEATEKIIYHVEIAKTNWAESRTGAADWTVHIRTGATGDTEVQLDTVTLKRVSADGNTVRATITVTSGATDQMGADTTITKSASANTTLDNPTGATNTDHLAVVFTCDNTNQHGPDESITIEQNTSAGTRVITPIDDAPEITPVAPLGQIINVSGMI